jgi:S-(hydroxymethyl)glutathione dehydrogenase/alcohol dehydrogenase
METRLTQKGEAMHQFLSLSSFAEYLLVHEHAVVKVSEEMPFDRAALLGCAVITGVGSVFHTAKVEPGTSVAVIGCGGIGLAAINGAAIAGAGRIIAIDRVPAKLDLAEKFGATDVINANDVNVVKQVRELTRGGVHYSFEAIGLKVTAEQAFQMLRPGGTATVIGMLPGGVNLELRGIDFMLERKIQGTSMGSNRFRVDVPRFVDFYLSGRLHLDEMIGERIKLDQVNQALQALETGEMARSIIEFN